MAKYDESSIQHLEPLEHIRKRPGMYIGKLGNGKSADDGIYVLVKEVLDNCIDEYRMGSGKSVGVELSQRVNSLQTISIRDSGRGIPLGKLVECVSQINTGGKYDDAAFQKSIGLNGVGTKAVNALSSAFMVTAARDGKIKTVEFEQGKLKSEGKAKPNNSDWLQGTFVAFSPDPTIFSDYEFEIEYLEKMFFYYACLNPGLVINFSHPDGQRQFLSQRGLPDFMESILSTTPNYPLIHLKTKEDQDVEITITHGNSYGEEIHSFVNGQNTRDGGTHVAAFKEALVKTFRDFYKKEYDPSDIRGGIVAAISIRVQEPLFESQTKTKLGSTHTLPALPGTGQPQGIPIRSLVVDFVKVHLDSYLRKNPEIAKTIQEKITQNESERKEMLGLRGRVKALSKETAVANPKLRDCRIHWDSTAKADQERKHETTLFIVEGDSACGPISRARDTHVQAVFPLRGKPFNCYNATRAVLYDNEELRLLEHALGLTKGADGLRFNNIVIATDADVDGMHIRLLLTTFFLRFHLDIVKGGHVYVLQTPLFRVQNKKEIRYCYNEEEKQKARKALGANSEVTRFKGLGEISDDEFKHNFIGPKMKLDPVVIGPSLNIPNLLEYYMGTNTPERQRFICENLVVEPPILE